MTPAPTAMLGAATVAGWPGAPITQPSPSTIPISEMIEPRTMQPAPSATRPAAITLPATKLPGAIATSPCALMLPWALQPLPSARSARHTRSPRQARCAPTSSAASQVPRAAAASQATASGRPIRDTAVVAMAGADQAGRKRTAGA